MCSCKGCWIGLTRWRKWLVGLTATLFLLTGLWSSWILRVEFRKAAAVEGPHVYGFKAFLHLWRASYFWLPYGSYSEDEPKNSFEHLLAVRAFGQPISSIHQSLCAGDEKSELMTLYSGITCDTMKKYDVSSTAFQVLWSLSTVALFAIAVMQYYTLCPKSLQMTKCLAWVSGIASAMATTSIIVFVTVGGAKLSDYKIVKLFKEVPKDDSFLDHTLSTDLSLGFWMACGAAGMTIVLMLLSVLDVFLEKNEKRLEESGDSAHLTTVEAAAGEIEDNEARLLQD
eukprot:GHVU01095592.1.p1 GENE.GHVU01095592.1~~GHVU01095592.1.p1  ORF type:complete len:284 (+),score=25.80 GHVU01095592.1:1574-2425(+)